MTAMVAELLEEPTLPETVFALQKRLDQEAQLRIRFYDEITPSVKAEFINGQVIMHSPALAKHTQARQHIENLLVNYVSVHHLGIVHDEKTLCVFPRNDYEPDVVFFGLTKAAKIKPDTLKFPPPDFICEVLSSSTEKVDRGIKFKDYQAHGVREYWIVDPEAETLEQYVLKRDKSYELRLKSGSGDVQSHAIKGFQMPIRAIFDRQLNLKVLRDLLK